MKTDRMKTIGKVHAALMNKVKTLAERYDLTAEEVLAVLSHSVGACIAMQDQRIVTPNMAMKLVMDNIKQGNMDAINGLMGSEGPAH